MFDRLDFASFHSADTVEREEFCSKLISSLKQYGFVKLINHGVSPLDIDNAFDEVRLARRKLKSPHPPSPNPHRGYSAFGIENVSTHSNYGSIAKLPLLKDMKESYDIGSEHDELYSNIWPPAGVQDTFQPTLTSFFSACYQAEIDILDALSIGLGLPAQTLSQLHVKQSNELRLTHYPAAPRKDFAHSTRIATHTDFGTITLLFQDAVGGLQVESPFGSGEFVDIESGGRHECIINAGDCLQKWTGLHSARHRVHLPKPSQGGEFDQTEDIVDGRFSIAYFVKPDRAVRLCPLLETKELKDEGTYVTAGEFQQMRIQGTY
ncbi:putative Fe2OG dioxygenase domain-containing protein [Seiridium cardinale]